LKIGTGSKFEL